MICGPQPGQFDGDEPDPYEFGSGPVVKYRCSECQWTGAGARAWDHHVNDGHHAIFLRDLPAAGPIQFSCCRRTASTRKVG